MESNIVPVPPKRKLPNTTAETVVRTLETPGSIARNNFVKYLERKADDMGIKHDKYSIDNKDIIEGKEFFTATRLIETAAKSIFGVDYETKGDWWADSIVKTLGELVVDVATDPITYIPVAGEGSVIGKTLAKFASKAIPKTMVKSIPRVLKKGKGKVTLKLATPEAINATIKKTTPEVTAKIIKEAAPKVSKTSFRNNVGEDIIRSLGKTSATQMAAGGAIGFASPLEEGPEGDEYNIMKRVANAGKGMGIVFAGRPIMNGVVSSTKWASNRAIDTIYKGNAVDAVAKFKTLLSPSEQFAISRAAKDRLAYVSRAVKKVNKVLLKTHGAEKLDEAIKFFDSWIPKYTAQRNLWEKDLKKKGMKANDFKLQSQLTNHTNKWVITEMQKTGKWTPAMSDLVRRNRGIIDMHNAEKAAQYATRKGKPKHSPLTGIDIHTMEIFDKELAQGAGEGAWGWVRRKTTDDVVTGGLSAKERMNEEAGSVIFKMMQKEEKRATSFITQVVNKADNKYEGARRVLKFLDATTQNMKGAMLTLSHSWLVNNFVENTYRTYMEHGLIPAARVAHKQGEAALSRIPKIGKMFETDWIKDIKKITATENAASEYIEYNTKSGLAEIAVHHNAVGGGYFKDLMGDPKNVLSKGVLESRFGKKRLSEEIAEFQKRGFMVKGVDWALNTAKKAIGDTGSVMENAARLNSFEHFIKKNATRKQKKLISDYGYKKAIDMDKSIGGVYEKSSKMVNDVFFDYSDLSLGEEQILKRFLPFYSFYSKNLDYWGNKVSGDLAKANKGLKVPNHFAGHEPIERDAQGNDITEFNRLGRSEYERSIPHGAADDGVNTKTAGKLSIVDFLEAYENPSQYIKGKLHPLYAGSYNLAGIGLNKAGFDVQPTDNIGRKILPSTDFKGYREPRHNEKKVAMIDNLLGNTLNSKTGDKVGQTIRNPVTDRLEVTSDVVPIVATAMSTVLPVPILDTIAGVAYGDDLLSKISPVKTSDKTLPQIRRTRKRNEQESLAANREFQKQNNTSGRHRNYRESLEQATQVKIYKDPEMVREADKLHQEAMLEASGGSPFVNDATPKKTVWNKYGLKVSPSMINRLAKIEGNPDGTHIAVAEPLKILPDGTREKYPSIGYSLNRFYPMTYGEHKKGQEIKVGDTMDATEAALQLAAYVKQKQRPLDNALNRAGVSATLPMYDSLMMSIYNTGAGHLKKLTKASPNLAEYMMKLPVHAEGQLHPALVKRRSKEYYEVKEQADFILKSSLESLKGMNLKRKDFERAVNKLLKVYYFPDKYTSLKDNQKLSMPKPFN